MPQRPHERAVLVTGATRGIGLAMVREFVRLGHRVAGCGRDADAIADLRARHGEPHDFDVVDVASDGRVAEWVGRLRSGGFVPDLVLNNAALINRNAPLWKVPAAEFDAVVDVNVKGTVNVIRHVLPSMMDRRAGVIVNFSSGWGRATAADVAPYCATKWAVEGISRALAQELPPGLAVVALNPGIIDTDMLRSCFGGAAAGFPSPESWAKRAVPFLLSIGPEHNGRPLTAPGG